MSTQILSQAEAIVEMIDRLPADSVLIQHGVSWDDYEDLLLAVGEAPGLHISFDEGTLQTSPTIRSLTCVFAFRSPTKVVFFTHR